MRQLQSLDENRGPQRAPSYGHRFQPEEEPSHESHSQIHQPARYSELSQGLDPNMAMQPQNTLNMPGPQNISLGGSGPGTNTVTAAQFQPLGVSGLGGPAHYGHPQYQDHHFLHLQLFRALQQQRYHQLNQQHLAQRGLYPQGPYQTSNTPGAQNIMTNNISTIGVGVQAGPSAHSRLQGTDIPTSWRDAHNLLASNAQAHAQAQAQARAARAHAQAHAQHQHQALAQANFLTPNRAQAMAQTQTQAQAPAPDPALPSADLDLLDINCDTADFNLDFLEAQQETREFLQERGQNQDQEREQDPEQQGQEQGWEQNIVLPGATEPVAVMAVSGPSGPPALESIEDMGEFGILNKDQQGTTYALPGVVDEIETGGATMHR